MNPLPPLAALAAAFALLTAPLLHAQVPQLLSYQGRIAVGSVNFDGSGLFKFALVNSNGTVTFWSNDGSLFAGSGNTEPTNAVSLTVTKGTYSVLLGDTSLANMTAISASVWTNPDVRLRVWFNDGTHGSQLLAPDQRLAPNGYLPDGSVGSGALAANAVTSAKIAIGAVGSAQLGAAAVTNGNLANSSVTVTAGSGLGGGGTVALGGNVTLNNAGVLSINAGGGVTVSSSTGAITLGTNATSANSVGTLVLRDASGNFSAGTITANLNGNAATATNATPIDGSVTAAKLALPITAFSSGTVFAASSTSANALEGYASVRDHAGVYGHSTFDFFGSETGDSPGVWGACSLGGVGVLGTIESATTVGTGVKGKVTLGVGVYGVTSDSRPDTQVGGVVGENLASGAGVYGTSSTGNGVYGSTNVASTTRGGVVGENYANGGTAIIGNSKAPNSAGVAGIGDTANSTGIYARGSGHAGVFDGAVQINGNLAVTGNINYGSLTQGSDARFKLDIQPIGGALEKLTRLRGVSYDWNRAAFPERGFEGRRQLGVIAQEVESVLPEAVRQGTDGYYSVSYITFVPVLIEAVKEQQQTIEALREHETSLETRLAELKRQLADHDARDRARDARIARLEQLLPSAQTGAIQTTQDGAPSVVNLHELP